MKLSHCLTEAILFLHALISSCNCHNLRGQDRKLESWPEWPNDSYNEVKIPVYNNLCKSAWDRYLIGATKAWSESKTVDLSVIKKYGNICKNEVVQYEDMINVVEIWEPSWNMASFVQSSIYKDNVGKKRFKSAVVILNDAILMNPVSPYFSYEYRMKNVCKVFGFALGLHNAGTNYGTINDQSSCMDPSSTSLSPSSQDFDLLEKMYFDANNRNLDIIDNSMKMAFFNESHVNQTFASLNDALDASGEYEDKKSDEVSGVYYQPIDMNNVGDLVEEDYADGVTTKFYVQDNGDYVSYSIKTEYDKK